MNAAPEILQSVFDRAFAGISRAREGFTPQLMPREVGTITSVSTAIALDTILDQRDRNVLCVYCAIGQRASAVAKVVANLRERGAMDYTVVVVAEGNDPPGLAYIAPYVATSITEHFMEAGRDVLIIYDDLTHHARAYRELSLLLRRPPGREAFPGDIFYIHSRLLERATHLSKERGGGSLTALPIIETEAQKLALTAELFDRVPLERMKDAEHAMHEAAAKIPAEVCARFETADKLSDEDRKTIVELARQTLAPFQPKPEAKGKS